MLYKKNHILGKMLVKVQGFTSLFELVIGLDEAVVVLSLRR
jgi:hypothetical protein